MARDTPIHVDLLDSSDVKRFAEAAEKLCDLFERVDHLSKIDFLQQLEELLPLVYHLGHRLPDPYKWEEDDDDAPYEPGPDGMSSAEHMACWKDMHDRVTAKLGAQSIVHFVYDPASPSEREAILVNLGLVLADVYVDLKEGLILYRRPSDVDRARGVWELQFDLGLGWGREVAEAMLPIHSLIHNHYDEDDEVFRYD